MGAEEERLLHHYRRRSRVLESGPAVTMQRDAADRRAARAAVSVGARELQESQSRVVVVEPLDVRVKLRDTPVEWPVHGSAPRTGKAAGLQGK